MSEDERRRISNRKDNCLIHDELENCSNKLLMEFESLFPAQEDNVYDNWCIEILTKDFFDYGDYFPLYLYWNDPYTDFWKRWNRFKNLKVFL
jgi:hypothetical protein